jgi:predicted ester cyclase
MGRSRRHGVVTLVSVGFLFAMIFAGAARSAPAPSSAVMTQSETAAVMADYQDAMFSNGSFEEYFADNIVITMVDVNQRIVGKDAARDAMVQLNQVAFNASTETKDFIVGPGIASSEAVFTGVQIGDYAGIPMTRRQVEVPYSIFWELEGGKITSLKIYGLVSGIMQQLTSDSYIQPEPIGLTTP